MYVAAAVTPRCCLPIWTGSVSLYWSVGEAHVASRGDRPRAGAWLPPPPPPPIIRQTAAAVISKKRTCLFDVRVNIAQLTNNRLTYRLMQLGIISRIKCLDPVAQINTLYKTFSALRGIRTVAALE